jgi:TolB protein
MKQYLFYIILIVVLFFSAQVQADIEISAPGQQSIPLALTRFLPQTGSVHPEIAAELEAVLTGDLEFSGIFSLVDPAAFLSDAQNAGLLSIDVDFEQWRMLGAESLIKGTYAVRGDELVVEARLFDVQRRKLSTGRRYVGKIKDLRRMGHKFADLVLQELTGISGAFNTKVAYISKRTGKRELYLMDSDGYGDLRLTNHRSIVLNPDFTPDAKHIVYTSYKNGNPDLYRQELSSGKETTLSARKGLNVTARNEPKGDGLAVTLSRDGNSEIYRLTNSGQLDGKLASSWGIDINPTWSPDGKQIAFVSDRQGNPNIFIADVGSNDARRLTHNGKYNANPAWSPQGGRIAFTRMINGVFDIYTIRLDGTDERRLTFGTGNSEHPTWSPDGRFLAYTFEQGDRKTIQVMRADGSGVHRLSPPGVDAQQPAWSLRW